MEVLYGTVQQVPTLSRYVLEDFRRRGFALVDCGYFVCTISCVSRNEPQGEVRGLDIRKVLVVNSLDQKGLSCYAGALGEKFRGDSSPRKLVVLGIRNLVVSSLLIHAFVEPQKVNVSITDLRLAIQHSTTRLVNICALGARQ